MSARSGIVDQVVSVLKTIDGTGANKSNLYDNVTKKLLFWDEVSDFPHVSVVAGSEQRAYLPSDFKWGFLNINLKVYVNAEDPIEELESLLQDIERVIDDNNELEYEPNKTTQDIRIISIETDEGLLAPYGVGDLVLQVRYHVLH